MEDEGGFTIRPTTARTIALAKKPTGEMLADETKVTAMYEGQPYDGIIKGHSMAARTYEVLFTVRKLLLVPFGVPIV